MPTAYLEPVAPVKGPRHELANMALTIGRHPTNRLMLTDDKASRFHCVIERVDNGFSVHDLNSRNGTKVNDQLIDRKMLAPGDVLRIGDTLFRFVIHQEDAAASPRPPKNRGVPGSSGAPPAVRRKKGSDAADPLISPLGDAEGDAEDHGEGDLADAISQAAASYEAQSPPPRPSRSRPTPAPESDPLYDDASSPGNDASPPDNDAIPLADEALPSPEQPDETISLKALLQLGPGKDLQEDELALVNTRGETTHAARQGKAKSMASQGEGVLILRRILLASMRTRATDIHIEPRSEKAAMRLRIDGTMVDAATFEPRRCQLIAGVVKILCDIENPRQNIVEEGHFSCNVRAKRVDYRVSFTPSMYGQKLVIRVLDLANAPRSLRDLMMPDWMAQAVQRITRQDTGMILVAGPTGSGKTTTLYNVLREIDVRTRNVLTIEDPVEYQLQGVTQIPIDERKGENFATLLRSVLRQDPDVIFVGEVRDMETARIAMQAAMTGHLVFSTIHARDTVGTIFRLFDLGIEPYLIASGLNLILAQRLIRLLCPHCKAPRKPTPQETMRMGRAVEGVSTVYTAVGCPQCVNTGYSGRRGVYELLTVTDALRDIILKNPTLEAIRDCLKTSHFVTLNSSGYKLVSEGVTSIEEVERVTGMD